MDIRGYMVDPQPSDLSPDGFMTSVTSASGEIRGPFSTISAAIACAHAWAEEAAKGKLKAVEDAAPAVEPVPEQPETEQPAA